MKELAGLELDGPQLARYKWKDNRGLAFAVCCVPCFDDKG